VIWDPYSAVAETSIGARILTDGTGLVENRGFFLASQKFVDQNPQVVTAILEELKTTSQWAQSNPQKVAEFLSKETGIDVDSLLLAEKRRNYGVDPLTPETIAGQQKIADTFYRLKLIPKEISIQSVVKNLV
jgi:sulfonate transport system substrate-binding protein